jgi:transposase
MTTSPDTLLCLIRTGSEPAFATPRVLGVDDWAIRKGQTYGTILVDLEKACVIDLLPNRTSETVSAWLKRYPDIEVLSSARASGYANRQIKHTSDKDQCSHTDSETMIQMLSC